MATDDRGAVRAVVSTRELGADARTGDPAFAAVVERVARLKVSSMRMGWIVVAGTVGMVVVQTIPVRLFATPISPYLLGAVAGLIFPLFFMLALRRAEKRQGPETARIMLADGLCPCCAYGLADLPHEHDACVVCPECGGAWRSDRIIRAARYRDHPRVRPAARAYASAWYDGIGGPLRITDDSGTPRPLASPKLRREIAAAQGERRGRLAAASKRNRRCGITLRIAIAAFYIGLAGTSLWFASRFVTFKPALWGVMLAATAMVGFSLCFLRGSAGVTTPWMRREMLAKGLCPSCAADLVTDDPLSTTPDCAIPTLPCRECGARWEQARGRTGGTGL
ncbi:MAG: hypothetical protein ACKVZJ_13705 [Phycisphaerales bacterium]